MGDSPAPKADDRQFTHKLGREILNRVAARRILIVIEQPASAGDQFVLDAKKVPVAKRTKLDAGHEVVEFDLVSDSSEYRLIHIRAASAGTLEDPLSDKLTGAFLNHGAWHNITASQPKRFARPKGEIPPPRRDPPPQPRDPLLREQLRDVAKVRVDEAEPGAYK